MYEAQLEHRDNDDSQQRRLQDRDSIEQPSSVQDPGFRAQPKRERTRHHQSYDVTDKESFTKDRMGEIDKHVSNGINKLLIENKCDLTSQENLSTYEAKKLPDSLNLTLRDECHE